MAVYSSSTTLSVNGGGGGGGWGAEGLESIQADTG